jgi:hypothetical protein
MKLSNLQAIMLKETVKKTVITIVPKGRFHPKYHREDQTLFFHKNPQ